MKKPPLRKAKKARQAGHPNAWTASFNHDLKSVKSKASKTATSTSMAKQVQSQTGKFGKNSARRRSN